MTPAPDDDETGALSSPVRGPSRYDGARPCRHARLKFYYGPMDCGKSTLALQMDHNHARQGRRGLLLTRLDRAGAAQITSRIGLTRRAVEVVDGMDLRELVRSRWSPSGALDYLICDEVQFYHPDQIEQLVDLVDDADVDVYAFGLASDFRSQLFPATKRLFELADGVYRLQVEVLCWCGLPGQLNARVVGDKVVREGGLVVLGDTTEDAAPADVPAESVRYQVLCRPHYRAGDLGPGTPTAGQLPLG